MEQTVYLTVGIVTAAILALVFVGIIFFLIWLRFFALRPCRKVKSVEHTPDGLTITTMEDGNIYIKFGDREC